jgi:PadR family transcriptional regulator, regulatory protein PadR
MRRQKNDVLRGTLDLLVLKTLAVRGALHGYAITQHIQERSADLLRVEEGSLYPALHRMTQDRWITGRWGATEKNRQARFYSITAAGRARLEEEEGSWARLTEGVSRLLGTT